MSNSIDSKLSTINIILMDIQAKYADDADTWQKIAQLKLCLVHIQNLASEPIALKQRKDNYG